MKAPTGAFPPNKSAGLSARSCVTSQVHEAILWAIFLPQQGIVSMFFSGVGRQPISALVRTVLRIQSVGSPK